MVVTALRVRNDYQVANVDVFSGSSFIWAEIITRLILVLNKPVNLTLRGGGLPEFYARNPERVRRLLCSVSSINTPSVYLQKSFSSIRPDIQWLPNGIDLIRYSTRDRSFNKPHLIWLRAFHNIYNPEMAVDTLEILRSKGVNCSLTMIGPDKRDGTLEAVIELAKKKKVFEYIHVPGPVKKAEVPQWLEKGDIFLNTTRFESFGVGVVEAAACGLPIVTTSVGELPYLWKNELDALLVPSNDPASMADAVCRILTEPGLAQRLSVNARQKAESFDWSIVLPQWEALFTRLGKAQSL